MIHPVPHLAYRPDIDGLRAFAVLAVVMFHAFPALLPGGFIGVDVFFVISGYLISLIIFKAHASGGLDLADFYARRIRRIFPALLVVVFASLVLGWSVLLPDEYAQLGKHGLAGLAFVANVVFWQEAGYFDTAAELKPFLHLWSLGIEEQFYIVWPAVVAWAWHRGISPVRVILVLGAASLAACVLLTATHPQAGFFLPPTRAWELLCGALLAWRMHYRGGLFDGAPSRLASGASVVGAGLLLSGLVLIDGTRDFPGAWALLPVSGTVLMIAAGSAATINRRLFAHPVIVWFGLISFPLYLWHWPLLSFVRIVFADRLTEGVLIAIVGLAVLLAWITYRLVETPIRHQGGRRAAIGLVLSSVVAAALAGNIMSRDGLAFRLEDAQAKREARALEWPDALRSDARCTRETVHGRLGGWCLVADHERPPTAMIIGDSHANHYFWALKDGVRALGGNLLQIASGACMPVEGIDLLKEGRYLGCPAVIDAAIEYAIAAPDITTVFLAGRWGGYIAKRELRDWASGKRDEIELALFDKGERIAGLEGEAAFRQGFERTLQRLEAAGKRVVLMHMVPELDFNARECIDWQPNPYVSRTPRPDCAVSRSLIRARDGEFRPQLEKVLAAHPAVRIFDPQLVMCSSERCSGKRDGVLLYRDDDHLSLEGTRWLGARMQGVLPDLMARAPLAVADGQSADAGGYNPGRHGSYTAGVAAPAR